MEKSLNALQTPRSTASRRPGRMVQDLQQQHVCLVQPFRSKLSPLLWLQQVTHIVRIYPDVITEPRGAAAPRKRASYFSEGRNRR